MKTYVVKCNRGTCWVDVFIMSELDVPALRILVEAMGGLPSPMGWVYGAAIMAILDCAQCGIKPPVQQDNVAKLHIVGGKDDARGRCEGETAGLPQEPGT